MVVAGYNLLHWHILFGLLLTAAVSAHMVARAKPLAARHQRGHRRFTGSREGGSYRGNGASPVVSWVADRPAPMAVADWRLQAGGAVRSPLDVTLADIGERYIPAEVEAILDCTGAAGSSGSSG